MGGGASKFGLFLPHDGGLCSPPQSGQGSEGISTLVHTVTVTLKTHTVTVTLYDIIIIMARRRRKKIIFSRLKDANSYRKSIHLLFQTPQIFSITPPNGGIILPIIPPYPSDLGGVKTPDYPPIPFRFGGIISVVLALSPQLGG